MSEDLEAFEAHRPALLGLAYRMLGDLARAEDAVQDAWLRWQGRQVHVQAPKAFLVTTVTRLCLDELGSARARREESRSDRLPEPVDLGSTPMGLMDEMDRISMAFLVVLQRLTPVARAVFLLHDVFDMTHAEIGAFLGKNDAACRQLLRRAREQVATEERARRTSQEEHRRLLGAFVQAVTAGESTRLLELLAEDAVLIADAGSGGARYGRIRNVGRPLVGRWKIGGLLSGFASQNVPGLELHERTLNGEPAMLVMQGGRPFSAILLSVADGKIDRVFVQIDPQRLRRLG